GAARLRRAVSERGGLGGPLGGVTSFYPFQQPRRLDCALRRADVMMEDYTMTADWKREARCELREWATEQGEAAKGLERLRVIHAINDAVYLSNEDERADPARWKPLQRDLAPLAPRPRLRARAAEALAPVRASLMRGASSPGGSLARAGEGR